MSAFLTHRIRKLDLYYSRFPILAAFGRNLNASKQTNKQNKNSSPLLNNQFHIYNDEIRALELLV